MRDELARFGMDYLNADLGIVAISANDPDQYPEDGPEAVLSARQARPPSRT